MGTLFGKKKTLTNQEVQLYSQQTQLQPFVIQQIYDAFQDRAGGSGQLTVAQFKMAYSQINPYMNMYTADADAERAFMMYDTDRNGVLTFNEFLIAYVSMQRGIVF